MSRTIKGNRKEGIYDESVSYSNYLDIHYPNNPDVQTLKKVLLLLQQDSIVELGEMMNSCDRYRSDTNDHVDFTTEQQICFLALSNIANRADELVETATQALAKNSEGTINLEQVLTRGRMGGDNKPDERVNFYEVLTAIQNFAEDSGIDTTDWEILIPTIIQEQVKGMEAIATYQNTGQMYSIDFAVNYRKGTIYNYGKLLSTVIDIPEVRDHFVNQMMTLQFSNDLYDTEEDHLTQVNPFVALLEKYGVLDDFLGVKLYDFATFLEKNAMITDFQTRLNFIDDLKVINKSYSEEVILPHQTL